VGAGTTDGRGLAVKRERAMAGWGLVLLGATLFELIAVDHKRSELTLSAFTRDIFRTDTKLGRAAFLVAWGALSAWFPRHVLRGARWSSSIR